MACSLALALLRTVFDVLEVMGRLMGLWFRDGRATFARPRRRGDR